MKTLPPTDTIKVSKAGIGGTTIPAESVTPVHADGQSLFDRFFAAFLNHSTRQGLVVLFDQGGYSLATFLTGMLIARACTKAEYGTFVLGLTLLFFSGVVQRSLVAIPYSVLSQSLANEKRSAYLGSSLLQHIALSSLIFFGFVLALVAARAFQAEAGMTKLLLALAGATVAVHFRTFVRTVLLAELRPWMSFAMGTAANTITIGGIVILYSMRCLTAVTGCLAMALGSLLPAAAVLFKERKSFRISSSQVSPDFVKNWHYGRWILAATGVNVAGIRIIPWLTLLWCGKEIVATVAVITMVACIVRPALEGALVYLTPKLAIHVQSNGIPSAIRKAMVLLEAAIILGCVYVFLMFVFGDRVVGIVYTSRYQGYGVALTIMAAAISIKAANIPIRALLTAMNRPKAIYHSSLCASVVAVLAGIVMIPRFGVIGVAFVVMMYHMVSLCVNYLSMSHWSKRPAACEQANAGAAAIRC